MQHECVRALTTPGVQNVFNLKVVHEIKQEKSSNGSSAVNDVRFIVQGITCFSRRDILNEFIVSW